MTFRKQLGMSLVSLLLCVSMLLGTTFAWFTDAVSSNNNIIQSGNLDANMYYSDTYLAPDASGWLNADGATVFQNENFEPDAVEVKYIKVENAGNLSFRWKLSIKAQGEMTDLAEVLDVYYVNPVSGALGAVVDLESVGTLDEVVENNISTSGVLLPENKTEAGHESGSVVLAIALRMQEEAGNKYKGEDLGDGFAISLIATQYTYEKDSFGNSYDENAKWPNNVVINQNSATASVSTDAEGKVSAPVSMTSLDNKIKAEVPAGVLLENGTNKVTLRVGDVADSNANIVLDETEATLSIDVHIDGVAEDNEVVMAISVKELLPVGLNMGNFRFYHVEDGVTVTMTLYDGVSTPVHNNFAYDPATGDVTLYMKSFSEVAAVADTVNPWEGEFDYTWYDADATELTVANADQLAALGAIVGGMNGYEADDFSGKTVKLLADINLGDAEDENNSALLFYPIGYYNNTGSYDKVSGKVTVEGTEVAVSSYYKPFSGTFDGNGNTISNFYQNTWEMFGDYNDGYSGTPNHSRDGMGLFGYVYGGTIKNLTVDNFSSDGEFATTGVIAAYADSKDGNPATFTNIAITNCNPRVYNIGNGGIVGCVGWYSRNDSLSNTGNTNAVAFRNITVDQTNKISALWGSYDVSCGGILGQYYPNSGCGVTFDNCHVAAIMDVNNDVCANYQYYWYRYSGMLIGTIRANKTEGNYTVADTTGISVTNCTYALGDWNEYWYCELVKNSLASYTHDHQFSRLTKIASLDEIKSGDTWTKEGNFVLPNEDNTSAECYHIFRNSNGELYQHFHDVADESNPDIYETFDLNGDGELNDLKEDRTCYFMPFNQVFNGLGYGVKPTYAFDGLEEVTNGTVKSEEKFDKLDAVVDMTYRPGQTITLGDLVALKAGIDETKLSKATLYALVSPAVGNDNTKVSATYTLNEGNWADSQITFGADCTSAVKIVITDYFYCTPTVIVLNEEGKTAKFEAKSVSVQNAYTQITLGDLFTAIDGADFGENVTATVTDPSGNKTTVTGTSSDWASKTIDLTKDGDWTVVIQGSDAYCGATTVTFTVNKVDKFEVAFDHDDETEGKQNYLDTYLYRVGNQNTVTLGSLFGEIATDVAISSVSVTIANSNGNASGTFTSNATWTNGTIQFSGTGVVTVSISADGANALTLTLEVVDAYNVTTYSGGNYPLSNRNSVLLDNITMSSGSSFYLSSATLYGNGFTFDMTDGAYTSGGNVSSNYVFALTNANLDNVQLVGAVYTTYGAQVQEDYNRAAVLTSGNCKITNSYISNCASAVRIKDGYLEIVNTTLKGGNFANLDIRNGQVVLEDVTTINQSLDNDKAADGSSVVGLGIVIYYEQVQDTTTLEIKGTLTQYNHISDNDTFSNSYANALVTEMLGTSHTDLQYEADGVTWVNTGVVVMTPNMSKNVKDNRFDTQNYVGKTVTFNTVDGYVYTYVPTAESIVTKATQYVPTTQEPIAPSYSFDYETENYIAKETGSNDYCYEDNGTVYISMDQGDTFDWNTAILTVTKNGQTLSYTVSLDGVDYTNKNISFDVGGDYYIEYSYVDANNYNLDENGKLVSYEVTYIKTVHINVTVVAPDAKNAEFTFGTDGGVASTQLTIGDNTYVMPDVSATTSTIGSITVSGTTVYYPIVDAYTSDGKTAHSSANSWYMCFPVFKGAVTITDYENSGLGNAVTYNSSTTSMPSGLSLTAYSGYLASVPNGAVSFTKGGADDAFKYQASAAASAEPTTLNNVLIYASPNLSNNARDKLYLIVQYKYQDNAGATYYYYVGYHMPETTVKSVCVTPDTMVTLADGTQKRIDQITYEDNLLVWDFFKGEYTVAPSSIIFNHGYDNYRVLTLNFEDGITVKVITNHGFYHAESDSFVFIDENNVESYIGSEFVRMDGDEYSTTKLLSFSVAEEYTGSYSIQSAMHNNFMVEGMFSITEPEYEGWFDYFEIGEGMKYDEEKMNVDIEKYGLYTYEEFAEYVTYEQFLAFNGPYLKVLVGRGVVTYEQIIELIAVYVN